jgi:hypothetical protein
MQSEEELLFGKSVNIVQLLQQPLLKKLNYYMLFTKYFNPQKLNQMENDVNKFVRNLRLYRRLK